MSLYPQGTSNLAKQLVGWERGEERELTKERISTRNPETLRERPQGLVLKSKASRARPPGSNPNASLYQLCDLRQGSYSLCLSFPTSQEEG